MFEQLDTTVEAEYNSPMWKLGYLWIAVFGHWPQNNSNQWTQRSMTVTFSKVKIPLSLILYDIVLNRFHKFGTPQWRPQIRRMRSDTAHRLILQWRNNESDGVLNHQHLDCFLNRLFRRRAKKISKLRVTGSLWRESTGHRWIPLTKTSGVTVMRCSSSD